MSLTMSENTSYQPAPAGLHNAVNTIIADLGTQRTSFGGKVTRKDQVLFGFELPETEMDNGEHFTLFRKFTATFKSKGTLRPTIESWRGKPFTAEELLSWNLRNVLGKPCKLLVEHKLSNDGTRTYANIKAILPADKNASVETTAAPIFFDHDSDEPDGPTLAKLPGWIRDLILAGEKPQPKNTPPAVADFNDDIPF